MADNNQPTTEAKRKLNITLSSYTLFATPRTRKDRKQLRITFGCSNGYPNVNMETDEDGEPTLQNGFLRLSSRLNGINWNAFLNLIKQAVTEEPGWKRGVECFHTFKDGVQHEEKQKINDLTVGVDNQGLVFITIIQPGRTGSKFVFGPSDWHNYRDGEGNNLSQKEINHMCAIAAADGLREAMGAAIAIDSMDLQTANAGLPSPSKKPEDGQGGGNNYQRNFSNNGQGGNNQGGYQKKPWQGNNGNNQNGGYQKKPWQGNNGGNNGGGYQKKPWQGNNGGGGNNYQRNNYNNQGGGYQKKWDNNQNQGGNNQQQSAPKDEGFDDEIEF